MQPAPQILPYGVADYTAIRAESMTYVDKTRYIAELEKSGRFLFFFGPAGSESLYLSISYGVITTSCSNPDSTLFFLEPISATTPPQKKTATWCFTSISLQ